MNSAHYALLPNVPILTFQPIGMPFFLFFFSFATIRGTSRPALINSTLRESGGGFRRGVVSVGQKNHFMMLVPFCGGKCAQRVWTFGLINY